MVEKTLKDAFYETLKDVYYAEKQSVRALKKSAKAAEASELKEAFTKHAEESATQVERLVQVFEHIGKPARAKTCEAMQGLTAEMEEDLEDFGGTAAADDVLIGCAGFVRARANNQRSAVCQGGKSSGRCRQAQPVRSTWSAPSSSAHRPAARPGRRAQERAWSAAPRPTSMFLLCSMKVDSVAAHG
jgi:hypothetical protein